jgi:hypothetical protein
MAYNDDVDCPVHVMDHIDNPVVSHTDPPEILGSNELSAFHRARVLSQILDPVENFRR